MAVKSVGNVGLVSLEVRSWMTFVRQNSEVDEYTPYREDVHT